MIKRFFTSCLSLLLVTQMISSVVYVNAEEINTVQVTVNEGKIVKHTSDVMYGINYEWGGDIPAAKVVGDNVEIDETYIEAFDGVMPMARAAGMSANRLYWKGAIGKYSERTLQKFWYFDPRKQVWGPVEWFKANTSINPDTQFTFAINLYDTQENIADFVEFVSGDGTVNYNGGINWAKKRIELGLEKPINILAYELGNEIDAGSEGAWNIERYLDACRRTIATIRSVDPDAKICVMRKTTWTGEWAAWHRTLLAELGDEIDFIAMHQYYYSDNVCVFSVGEIIKNDILNITGEDRIKILVTEQASKSTSDKWGTAEYRRPHTMDGVLSTAEWYVRAASMPYIYGAAYHCCFDSAGWAVVSPYEGKMLRTSIGDLIRLCNQYFVGDTLEVNMDGYKHDVENAGPEVMGAAVKTEKGINLILVNQKPENCTFNFDFAQGNYKLTGRSIITAPELTSDKWREYNEISYTDEEINDNDYISSYTAEPYSVTALELELCDVDEQKIAEGKFTQLKCFAPNKYFALLDGEISPFNNSPIMYNDRMYIPLKEAANLFGYEFYTNDIQSELFLKGENKELKFIMNSGKYYENGIEKDGGIYPIALNNQFYIPLRLFAQIHSYNTYWDNRGFAVLQNDKRIEINSEKDKMVLDMVNEKLINERGIE